MKRTLIIFVKAPMIGRAKTRLTRGIGAARAATFYRNATSKLIDGPGRDRRWHTLLAVAPPSVVDGGWEHLWGRHLPRIDQGTGDLGHRLRRLVSIPATGPVVIIGSDAPQVTSTDIAMAFRRLGQHDAVFGPAADGGYWLIGLARRRSAPRLFEEVRWSTADALADTLASLPTGFRVAAPLRTIRDIDEHADWHAEQHALRRCGRP